MADKPAQPAAATPAAEVPAPPPPLDPGQELELAKARRGEPVDPAKMPMMHLCAICKNPIRKNTDSYRGPMSAGFIAAARRDAPKFHPKMDICRTCGEKYAREAPALWRPAGHRV